MALTLESEADRVTRRVSEGRPDFDKGGSSDELKAGSLGYVDGAARLVPDADVYFSDEVINIASSLANASGYHSRLPREARSPGRRKRT